jgi:CheY-like chemotaxis protein
MPRPYNSLQNRNLNLARVLIVHGDLASRLALQTILQAGGYHVDAAANPAEAVTKLDEKQYDLVLSDAQLGSSEDGRKVLAYAKVKPYQPATALITSSGGSALGNAESRRIAVHTENLPGFLGKVADLIGLRAIRRYQPLRQAM